MDEPEIDVARLRGRWAELWPGVPFLDVLTAKAPGRDVRFHSLPKSKRYPDGAQEWAQVLHRQLTLLGQLVESSPSQRERLLLVTRAYSDEPTWNADVAPLGARGEWFDLLVPSTQVASVKSDSDPGYPTWVHHFVARTSLADPRLISALTLRAEFDQGFPFVIPEDLSWGFVPYDGGVDIVAPTARFADLLSDEHSSWLPYDGPARDLVEDGTPVLDSWPERNWAIGFARMDEFAARRVVELIDEYAWGAQLVACALDPAKTLVLELDRPTAQLIRAAISGENERVFDSLSDPVLEGEFLVVGTDRVQLASPDDARRVLSRRLLEAADLTDFIDEYGYRPPEEAVDGRLDAKFWDPARNYSALSND